MKLKIKTLAKWGTTFGVILAIAAYLGLCTVSWIATCGIIKLITMCFGWTFSWAWATGIWLVMYLLRSVFSHTTTIRK